jgi:cytochrome c-type biogenesis protein CcmH/NrfF
MFIGSRNNNSKKIKWSWGSLIIGILYMLFGLFIIVGPTLFVAISFVWATGIFAVVAGALIVTSAVAFKNTVK